jgi:hypothetical protein
MFTQPEQILEGKGAVAGLMQREQKILKLKT